MPHIPIPNDLPGIVGLMRFKPSSGQRLADLAQQLLRGESPLSEGERETIAAFVSSRNDCYFCAHVHTAASQLVEGGRDAVCAVIDDADAAPMTEKMRALLRIAGKVQRSGKEVTSDDIAQARSAGASDEDIHDAVLVAAAFCMYNRYVDGLATLVPADPAMYEMSARRIVEHGYGA